MEKCSHATVNRTDVPLDGRIRLWVATVHDTSHTTRENCPLTTAPTTNGRLRVTTDHKSRPEPGNDWPRCPSEDGQRRDGTTSTVGDGDEQRPATTRPDGEQATSPQTADDKRLLDDPKSDDGQPDTTDDDEDLSPTRLTTTNGWVLTINDSLRRRRGTSQHTRLLTDEQQLSSTRLTACHDLAPLS